MPNAGEWETVANLEGGWYGCSGWQQTGGLMTWRAMVATTDEDGAVTQHVISEGERTVAIVAGAATVGRRGRSRIIAPADWCRCSVWSTFARPASPPCRCSVACRRSLSQRCVDENQN